MDLAVVTILMFFENRAIFFLIDFKKLIFGVFVKSCHDISKFVFLKYCCNALFFRIVLYSTSNRYGSYSEINLRMEILFFSLLENLPPSDLGLRVQIHLGRCFFIKFRASGILFGFIKSNLISI